MSGSAIATASTGARKVGTDRSAIATAIATASPSASGGGRTSWTTVVVRKMTAWTLLPQMPCALSWASSRSSSVAALLHVLRAESAECGFHLRCRAALNTRIASGLCNMLS